MHCYRITSDTRTDAIEYYVELVNTRWCLVLLLTWWGLDAACRGGFCHARFLRCFYVVTIRTACCVVWKFFIFCGHRGCYLFLILVEQVLLTRVLLVPSAAFDDDLNWQRWLSGADASLWEDQLETYATRLLLPTGWWLVNSTATSLGLQTWSCP